MSLFKPSVPFYTIQLPNADTIVSILPFLLFGMLLLTAIFATFISYRQILFVPDNKSQIMYSDWQIVLIPIGVLLFIFIINIILGSVLKK